jgi:hypothetical protein
MYFGIAEKFGENSGCTNAGTTISAASAGILNKDGTRK